MLKERGAQSTPLMWVGFWVPFDTDKVVAV